MLCAPLTHAQGMIFSAMLVRASKEYHTNTFLTHDVTLPSPLDDAPDSDAGAHAASCATLGLPEPWRWPSSPRAPPVACDADVEKGRCALELERMA